MYFCWKVVWGGKTRQQKEINVWWPMHLIHFWWASGDDKQMFKSSKYPQECRGEAVVVSPIIGNTPCVVWVTADTPSTPTRLRLEAVGRAGPRHEAPRLKMIPTCCPIKTTARPHITAPWTWSPAVHPNSLSLLLLRPLKWFYFSVHQL